MELNLHSMTRAFPPMDDAEYAALKADVAANGILQPLLVWQGAVVDGRHRLAAATELGISADRIPLRRLADDMPESAVVGLMIAANVQRRHLNQTQRAMIAARVERRRNDLTTVDSPTRAQRAGMFGVSVSLVRRADALTDTAPPELVDAVAAGDMTLRDAEALLAKGNATPSSLDAIYKAAPAAVKLVAAAKAALDDAAADPDARADLLDGVQSLKPIAAELSALVAQADAELTPAGKHPTPSAPPAPSQSKPAGGKRRNLQWRGKRG